MLNRSARGVVSTARKSGPPVTKSHPNPADPFSNPSPTPDLAPPEATPEPLPNEPPVEDTPGAPTPVHSPATPDHPFGPPQPIHRRKRARIAFELLSAFSGPPPFPGLLAILISKAHVCCQ